MRGPVGRLVSWVKSGERCKGKNEIKQPITKLAGTFGNAQYSNQALNAWLSGKP